MDNDLISRSAHIDKFTAEAKKIAAKDKDFAQALMYVVTCLDIAPAVDAVPVVQCPECKFSSAKHHFDIFEWVYCKKWNTEIKKHDFCSYGERRDDVAER